MAYDPIDRLVVASSNRGKIAEFDRLLQPLGLHVMSQSDFGVSAAPEPFETFLENALTKARHASQHTGLPALADDSGLCVPSLGGAPGVHSARYAASEANQNQDTLNNAKLLRALVGQTDRRAYYVAMLVFVLDPADPLPLVAQGVWHGQIIEQARGENGFGYDPYFWLPDLEQTAAQLPAAVKNSASHRGQAVRELVRLMQSRGLLRYADAV
jgi:XTP/dITP diphosphohydrolase